MTKAVEDGGLGFDCKWDLGWMHDTMQYFASHPHDRAFMPEKITFSVFKFAQAKLLNTDWEAFGGKTVKADESAVPSAVPPFTGLLFACRPE